MAKKKIELFLDINTDKEFEYILNKNLNKLICAEIYCTYFGSCTALDHLLTRIKLDWVKEQIVLLKVTADKIELLKRFRGQSQPMYMFILNKRVTQVFRGVDNIKFADIAKQELIYFEMEQEGIAVDRKTYEIDEATPAEKEWHKIILAEKQAEQFEIGERRAIRQAARKRHRAELMVPYLHHLNFVLYWPHATHAHPELYERWDINNIIMVGREEIELTKEMVEDVLYGGDAPLNEASLNSLLSAPALAICFRLLDTDKNFVALVRKILYEDIPPIDDTKPISEQPRQITAFELYKSFSPTREQIWNKRKEERLKKKDDVKYQRERRLSEIQRLARQAITEELEARKAKKERRKLELLKTGNLDALEKLKQELDNEEVDIVIPEELSDIEEEEISEEEDENEYFPPPGLLIPGFYAPPNEIAKVNGLAILFPKLVLEKVTPQDEFLPPHVLVMLSVHKRYKAISAIIKYKKSIIHMGIFKGTTPYDAVHFAYSVKQYDGIKDSVDEDEMNLAFMLSMKTDFALLSLMDLNPHHVSRDSELGEEECAAMFSVDYGDDYPEFEDFDDELNIV